MDLWDISEQALIFDVNKNLSEIASRLINERKHVFLVVENEKLKGIVSDTDIAKRNIDQPQKVKMKHLKGIVKPINPFQPVSEPNEIIEFMLVNSLRAVPVCKEGKFRIVTDVNMLKMLPKDEIKGKTASEIMVLPPCINLDSTLDAVHSQIRQTHWDIVVIVGNSGLAEGIIDSIDLLKMFLVSKEKVKRGEENGEKISSEKIKASSNIFLQTDVFRAKPNTPLAELMNIMIANNSDLIIIEDKKFRGVVTARSILKSVYRKVGGIHVIVSGQQKEDEYIKSIIHEEIENEIRKLGKIIPIDYIAIDIKRFEKNAVKSKYSVKARLITEKGFFFAEGHEWDITKTIRIVLSKLEREVLKRKGKSQVYSRGP